ncbi:MAG: Sensor histidine kinase RcsC [Bacteroidota bacterium]
MQQLSFKNRIASLYIITTALLIAVVFFVIYISVSFSVYSHVNDDIQSESAKHLTEIAVSNGNFQLIHKEEWMEREHNTIDVNPVFVQFIDENQQLVEKSPNLKRSNLHFNPQIPFNQLFDYTLEGKSIRQTQLPIYQGKTIVGYLLVAMSLENSVMVLNDLFKVLLIAYPSILVILFVIARLIAGRSIQPISSIMTTSNAITKDNLRSRIPLPKTKDELYILSKTINNLLDRLETAIEREKQFTSDASHELRTPLTVIKGTLEVLVRKPRTTQEYEEKINFCVTEVDRLNHLVDQLLLLARYENENQSLHIESVYLNGVLEDAIARQSLAIESKKIQILQTFDGDFYCTTDLHLFSIIINNLISNALKYSKENGVIDIQLKKRNNQIECVISDSGIGIPKTDLEKVFQPFYRSKAIHYPEIKGIGIGLSIVQRLCSLLSITVKITSREGVGTQVSLIMLSKDLRNS